MQYQKVSFQKNPALPRTVCLLFLLFWLPLMASAQLGRAVRQVIVTQPSSWTSNTATMQCYQRASARDTWQPVFAKPVPVLLGKKGLAWGRGVFGVPQNGIPMKVEKDWRAPAGVFQLGSLFGYAATPPAGARWPYVQVGPWDAYVDDSSNPYYNRHVRIDPRQGIPPWFEKQRMRLGDAAYKWMLEIRHNQQPPAAGYGSAIFFHVRRGPDKPSAGCTTMAEADLARMLRWLDPQAAPHYVLLPKADYAALRGAWGLP
jgi:L,D-peptidoglycan transpeptidase YkuD (ErfK/YbiS/YcfS/YnhG family)